MAAARSFLSWQAAESADGNSQFGEILLGINDLRHGQRRIEEAIKTFDGGRYEYRGCDNFGTSDTGSDGNQLESYGGVDLPSRQISPVFGELDDIKEMRRSIRCSLASFDEATNPRDSVYGHDSLLDPDWPSNIEKRVEADEFEKVDIDGKSVRKAMARRRQGGTASYTQKASSVCEATAQQHSILGLQPNGPFLLVKDWIGLVPLFNDLVVMPFIAAWNVDMAQGWPLLLLAWLSATFWTVDIGINFVTGIVMNGEVMLSLPTISWHYLTHWFAFDASVTLFDWTCIVLAMSPGRKVYEQVQIVKILRWARLFRDCRAAHLSKLLEHSGWMHFSQSNLRQAVMTVLDLILWISLGAHVLACWWFYMGECDCTFKEKNGVSWLNLPSGATTALTFLEEDHVQQYLASLQFVMALITLGSSDVLPQSSVERFFNILMLMVGFFAGTTIVSMMSGYVVQYILSIQEQAHAVSKLRKFLNQNRIHQPLQMEIMSQASVRMRDEQIVRDEDVPILKELPTTIQLKLMYETRLPILLAHPLFELWAAMDLDAIMQFCTEAITEKFHFPGDEVFHPGRCEAAYVVMLGRLRYEQSPETSLEIVPVKIDVPISHQQKDRWICEAALWSHWIHVGTLIADTACQVMVINAASMWRILVEYYQEIGATTRQYCINFYNRLVAACPPHAVFPTDICIQPHLDRHELLNQQVGIGLLHQAMQRDKVRLTKEQYEEIKQELVAHKCSLQQPCDGVFQRIVAVEALLVINTQKKYFIQIGEWDGRKGQGVKAVCQYPAKKRTMDELPQDTLRRLLSEDLKPFDDHIKIDVCVREVEEKDSKKLALPTTYNRTVHVASLKQSEDLLDLPVVKGSSEVPASLKSFLPRELYLVSSSVNGKLGFFTWMSETEFRRMKGDSNVQALQAWLSSFATPCILNANI